MVNEVFMEVGNDNGCSKNCRNWAEKYGKVLKYEDKMMYERRCELHVLRTVDQVRWNWVLL